MISHAPITSIAAAFILAVMCWAALRWRYGGIIAGLGGTIEGLKERLALRDEQLTTLEKKIVDAPDAEAAVLAAKAELAKQHRLAMKEERLKDAQAQ